MIDQLQKIEQARHVEGDMGVSFLYTAGVPGEAFLRGLMKGKILASTCPKCSRTYLPPRSFCEDCFSPIEDLHAVSGTGTVESLTTLHVDLEGNPGAPEVAAAIRIDDTDTTLLHRLRGGKGDEYRIGMRVEAAWAKKRTGSILDIDHFRPTK